MPVWVCPGKVAHWTLDWTLFWLMPFHEQEIYLRRVSAAFGGVKERRSAVGRSTMIDFVTAGEVAEFRTSETWFSGNIQEMPVHCADIFL